MNKLKLLMKAGLWLSLAGVKLTDIALQQICKSSMKYCEKKYKATKQFLGT